MGTTELDDIAGLDADAYAEQASTAAAMVVAEFGSAQESRNDAVPAKRSRKSAKPPRTELRIHNEPAFVLHSYPYKETSLIVDVLTRHHGRVALVARGAKRPRSALRGLLLAFQPLTLSWTGSRSKGAGGGSDLHTLTRAEWVGGLPALRGDGLLCGFYLNELLIRLLAREDAHEELFTGYYRALAHLASGQPAAPVLREFEFLLLREAGYALRLDACVNTGEMVAADGLYRYVPEYGPVRVQERGSLARAQADMLFSGKTLLDIDAGIYQDPVTLAQSKQLMRQLLQVHLAGQPLNTRQIMIDLQNL